LYGTCGAQHQASETDRWPWGGGLLQTRWGLAGPERWLTAQPDRPATITELQTLLDLFTTHDNHQRPHRSLPERCTPADAYDRRPKAAPGDLGHDTHDRVRHDTVDETGRSPSESTAACTTSASAPNTAAAE
jgi:hypothetical protein